MKTVIILLFCLLIISCEEVITNPEPVYPDITRAEKIPEDAVKMTPENDPYPPVLHMDGWEDPVPLEGPVNTAGAEDSPFIPAGRDELYIFFTPDLSSPYEDQAQDSVSGIWMSEYRDNMWQEPERVWLQDPGKLSLDGAEFVQGDEMWFASAREGYTGLHWFHADYSDGKWTNWQNADFESTFEVGEFHIHGNELYYHSQRAGGQGNYDIWKLTQTDGLWQNPVNLEIINTPELEGWPYITPDGNELWYTGMYQGTVAVYRSLKLNDAWQAPEVVISQFAGEPTMDKFGNIIFVHHYFMNNKMIEADLYVCYKK